LFVSQKWDYQPDILLLGKAVSGGYFPVAAALTTEAIFERFLGDDNYFMHGSTNSGHPVGAAVSLVAIDIILREKLAENSARVGAYLKAKLTDLMNTHPLIGEVRGRGLMIGIDLTRDRKTKEWLARGEIDNLMMSSMVHGLLASFPDCGVSLFPPLNTTEAVADEIVAVLDKVLHIGRLADLDRNAHMLKEFVRSKL
jgi:adenosylmethionine-8-amino-7-oxononanoate aminotransferase